MKIFLSRPLLIASMSMIHERTLASIDSEEAKEFKERFVDVGQMTDELLECQAREMLNKSVMLVKDFKMPTNGSFDFQISGVDKKTQFKKFIKDRAKKKGKKK